MRYGDGNTIHSTDLLNVEVDRQGNVLSVWFRCLHLPFDVTVVDDQRAAELRNLYKTAALPIIAIEVRD